MALSSGPLWEFVYWIAHMCGQVWKLSLVPLMKTKQGRWPMFYKWNKSAGCVCLSGLHNYRPLGEAHSTQIYSHSIGIIHWAVRIAVGSMSLSRAIYIVLNSKHVHSLAPAPVPVTYNMDFSPKHSLFSILFSSNRQWLCNKTRQKPIKWYIFYNSYSESQWTDETKYRSGWRACTNVLRVVNYVTRHRYCYSDKNGLWDVQILYTRVQIVTYARKSVEHSLPFFYKLKDLKLDKKFLSVFFPSLPTYPLRPVRPKA